MNRKTAILVIHGIGEQEPFETLDSFVKTFAEAHSAAIKKSRPDAVIQKKHSLVKFLDGIESAVSFTANVPDKPAIDVYEYYWAPMTQREITVGEVIEWMFAVAKGGKEFYKKQGQSPKNREKNDELFEKDGEFKSAEYLLKLLSAGSRLKILILYLPLILKIVNINPEPALTLLGKLLGKILKGPLADSFGDVALYAGADEKSKYFHVRKNILDGAIQKTKFLVESDDYDDIILISHSLGTVIAYDALARLNKMMNSDENLRKKASKIKGLVTFGCPLDKIAFFFDEKINKKEQAVRYAIISQLHGFKRVNVDTTTLENGVRQYLEHIKWFNFWTKPDPVSGHLDVYKDLENIELDFSDKIKINKLFGSEFSIKSHCLYWQSEEMHRRIIKEFDLA